MKPDKLYHFAFVLLIGILFSSCSKEKVDLSESDTKTMDLVVSLRLDPESIKHTVTRAAEDNFTATAEECKINKLTLFVTKMVDGHEVVDSQISIYNPNIDKLITFELDVKVGTYKRFYLGANMSQEQINAFSGEKTVYTVPDKTVNKSYSNAPFAMNINSISGAGSNVVMSAQILNPEGGQDFQISKGEVHIDEPIKLTRIVSKILLTCYPESTSKEHVKIKEGIGGWVRFSEMRYLINTFDKKFYLFPQKDENLGLLDVNYPLSQFLDKEMNLIDENNYYSNFKTFETEEIIEKLRDDFIPEYFNALPFEEGKTYTSGLYCLENRVKDDLGLRNNQEKFVEKNKLFTTYMTVAARYTPAHVYITQTNTEGNTELALYETHDERKMKDILSGQEETIGTQTHQYEDGTFWYYKNQYFNLDGILYYLKNIDKDADLSLISRYDGGWGYYASFIDGTPEKDSNIIGYPNETWGITRNNYYVLRLKALTPPGSPIPGVKIMMIPDLEPWKNKDVDLEMGE